MPATLSVIEEQSSGLCDCRCHSVVIFIYIAVVGELREPPPWVFERSNQRLAFLTLCDSPTVSSASSKTKSVGFSVSIPRWTTLRVDGRPAQAAKGSDVGLFERSLADLAYFPK